MRLCDKKPNRTAPDIAYIKVKPKPEYWTFANTEKLDFKTSFRMEVTRSEAEDILERLPSTELKRLGYREPTAMVPPKDYLVLKAFGLEYLAVPHYMGCVISEDDASEILFKQLREKNGKNK